MTVYAKYTLYLAHAVYNSGILFQYFRKKENSHNSLILLQVVVYPIIMKILTQNKVHAF